MQESIERALRQHSQGDKVLAETAAFRGLSVERFGDVFRGGQFGLDEQIS
jgi:hypothetical protein